MSVSVKKMVGAGFAAATLAGGMIVTSANTADARPGFRGGGGFGGGRAFVGGGGFRGPGARVPVVGGGFRGGFVGGPRFVGGRGFYGPRYGYGYRRGIGVGGAVAAGLVGGLALGAIASSPYYGGYGYGYPYSSGYGYGYAPVSYGYGGCTIERRRVFDAYGRVVIQDVEVC